MVSFEKPVTADNLQASDQVESGKLFGILGRVVGSTVPWRGIKLPTVNAPRAIRAADASSAGQFEPGAEQSVGNPDRAASAEEPLNAGAEDDPFGAATTDPPSEDDPFGVSGDDPFEVTDENMEGESAAAEQGTDESSAAEESEQPEEDDPFGEFQLRVLKVLCAKRCALCLS